MQDWTIFFFLLVVAALRGFVSNLNNVTLDKIDDSFLFVFLRFIFGFIVTIIASLIWWLSRSKQNVLRIRQDVKSKSLWISSAVSGGSAAIITIVLLILLSSIKSASILSGLFMPLSLIFTVLFGFFWLKEKLKPAQIIGVSLSLISIMILTLTT